MRSSRRTATAAAATEVLEGSTTGGGMSSPEMDPWKEDRVRDFVALNTIQRLRAYHLPPDAPMPAMEAVNIARARNLILLPRSRPDYRPCQREPKPTTAMLRQRRRQEREARKAAHLRKQAARARSSHDANEETDEPSTGLRASSSSSTSSSLSSLSSSPSSLPDSSSTDSQDDADDTRGSEASEDRTRSAHVPFCALERARVTFFGAASFTSSASPQRMLASPHVPITPSRSHSARPSSLTAASTAEADARATDDTSLTSATDKKKKRKPTTAPLKSGQDLDAHILSHSTPLKGEEAGAPSSACDTPTLRADEEEAPSPSPHKLLPTQSEAVQGARGAEGEGDDPLRGAPDGSPLFPPTVAFEGQKFGCEICESLHHYFQSLLTRGVVLDRFNHKDLAFAWWVIGRNMDAEALNHAGPLRREPLLISLRNYYFNLLTKHEAKKRARETRRAARARKPQQEEKKGSATGDEGEHRMALDESGSVEEVSNQRRAQAAVPPTTAAAGAKRRRAPPAGSSSSSRTKSRRKTSPLHSRAASASSAASSGSSAASAPRSPSSASASLRAPDSRTDSPVRPGRTTHITTLGTQPTARAAEDGTSELDASQIPQLSSRASSTASHRLNAQERRKAVEDTWSSVRQGRRRPTSSTPSVSMPEPEEKKDAQKTNDTKKKVKKDEVAKSASDTTMPTTKTAASSATAAPATRVNTKTSPTQSPPPLAKKAKKGTATTSAAMSPPSGSTHSAVTSTPSTATATTAPKEKPSAVAPSAPSTSDAALAGAEAANTTAPHAKSRKKGTAATKPNTESSAGSADEPTADASPVSTSSPRSASPATGATTKKGSKAAGASSAKTDLITASTSTGATATALSTSTPSTTSATAETGKTSAAPSLPLPPPDAQPVPRLPPDPAQRIAPLLAPSDYQTRVETRIQQRLAKEDSLYAFLMSSATHQRDAKGRPLAPKYIPASPPHARMAAKTTASGQHAEADGDDDGGDAEGDPGGSAAAAVKSEVGHVKGRRGRHRLTNKGAVDPALFLSTYRYDHDAFDAALKRHHAASPRKRQRADATEHADTSGEVEANSYPDEKNLTEKAEAHHEHDRPAHLLWPQRGLFAGAPHFALPLSCRYDSRGARLPGSYVPAGKSEVMAPHPSMAAACLHPLPDAPHTRSLRTLPYAQQCLLVWEAASRLESFAEAQAAREQQKAARLASLRMTTRRMRASIVESDATIADTRAARRRRAGRGDAKGEGEANASWQAAPRHPKEEESEGDDASSTSSSTSSSSSPPPRESEGNHVKVESQVDACGSGAGRADGKPEKNTGPSTPPEETGSGLSGRPARCFVDYWAYNRAL